MSFLTNFLNETNKAGQYDKNKGLLSNFSSQMGRSLGLAGRAVSAGIQGLATIGAATVAKPLAKPFGKDIKIFKEGGKAASRAIKGEDFVTEAIVRPLETAASAFSFGAIKDEGRKYKPTNKAESAILAGGEAGGHLIGSMPAIEVAGAKLAKGISKVAMKVAPKALSMAAEPIVQFKKGVIGIQSMTKADKLASKTAMPLMFGIINQLKHYDSPEDRFKAFVSDVATGGMFKYFEGVGQPVSRAALTGLSTFASGLLEPISRAQKGEQVDWTDEIAKAIPATVLFTIGAYDKGAQRYSAPEALSKIAKVRMQLPQNATPEQINSLADAAVESVIFGNKKKIGTNLIEVSKPKEGVIPLTPEQQRLIQDIEFTRKAALGNLKFSSGFVETVKEVGKEIAGNVKTEAQNIKETASQLPQTLQTVTQGMTPVTAGASSSIPVIPTTDVIKSELPKQEKLPDIIPEEAPTKTPTIPEPIIPQVPVYETYEGNLEEAQITPINQATGIGKILSAAKDAGDFSAYKMIIEKVKEPKAGTGVDGFAYRATILDPQGKIISNNSYVRNEDIPSIAADKFEVNIKDIIKTGNSIVPVYEVPQEVRLEDTEEIIQKREEIKKKYNARKLARKQGSQYNQEQPPVLADSDVSYTPQSPEPAPLQETQQDTTFKLSPQVAALFTPQAQTEAPIEATTELPVLDSGTPVKQPSIEEQLADTTPTDLEGTTDITEDESQFLPEGPVYYPGGFSIGEENVDTFADPNIPAQEISALEAVTGPNALRENPSLDPSSEEAQPALYKFVKGVVSSFKLSDKAKEEVMNALFPVKVAEVLALAEHPSITPEDVTELEDALKYIKIKSTLKIDNVLTSPEFTSFSTTSDARKKMYAGMMDAARADGNKLFKVYSKIQEKLNPVEEPVVENTPIETIPEDVAQDIPNNDITVDELQTTDLEQKLQEIVNEPIIEKEVEQQEQVTPDDINGALTEVINASSTKTLPGSLLKGGENFGKNFPEERKKIFDKSKETEKKIAVLSLIYPDDNAPTIEFTPLAKARDLAIAAEASVKKEKLGEDEESTYDDADPNETKDEATEEVAVDGESEGKVVIPRSEINLNVDKVSIKGDLINSIETVQAVNEKLNMDSPENESDFADKREEELMNNVERNDHQFPSLKSTDWRKVNQAINRHPTPKDETGSTPNSGPFRIITGHFSKPATTRPRELEYVHDPLFNSDNMEAARNFYKMLHNILITINGQDGLVDVTSDSTDKVIEALKDFDARFEKVRTTTKLWKDVILPVVDLRGMSADQIRDLSVGIIKNKIKLLPKVISDYPTTKIFSMIPVLNENGDRMVPLGHIFDSIPFTFIKETGRNTHNIMETLLQGIKKRSSSFNVLVDQTARVEEIQHGVTKISEALQTPMVKINLTLSSDNTGTPLSWDDVKNGKNAAWKTLEQLKRIVHSATDGSSLTIYITPEVLKESVSGESGSDLLKELLKRPFITLKRWNGKTLPKDLLENKKDFLIKRQPLTEITITDNGKKVIQVPLSEVDKFEMENQKYPLLEKVLSSFQEVAGSQVFEPMIFGAVSETSLLDLARKVLDDEIDEKTKEKMSNIINTIQDQVLPPNGIDEGFSIKSLAEAVLKDPNLLSDVVLVYNKEINNVPRATPEQLEVGRKKQEEIFQTIKAMEDKDAYRAEESIKEEEESIGAINNKADFRKDDYFAQKDELQQEVFKAKNEVSLVKSGLEAIKIVSEADRSKAWIAPGIKKELQALIDKNENYRFDLEGDYKTLIKKMMPKASNEEVENIVNNIILDSLKNTVKDASGDSKNKPLKTALFQLPNPKYALKTQNVNELLNIAVDKQRDVLLKEIKVREFTQQPEFAGALAGIDMELTDSVQDKEKINIIQGQEQLSKIKDLDDDNLTQDIKNKLIGTKWRFKGLDFNIKNITQEKSGISITFTKAGGPYSGEEEIKRFDSLQDFAKVYKPIESVVEKKIVKISDLNSSIKQFNQKFNKEYGVDSQANEYLDIPELKNIVSEKIAKDQSEKKKLNPNDVKRNMFLKTLDILGVRELHGEEAMAIANFLTFIQSKPKTNLKDPMNDAQLIKKARAYLNKGVPVKEKKIVPLKLKDLLNKLK